MSYPIYIMLERFDKCRFVKTCRHYDNRAAICNRSWGKWDYDKLCKYYMTNLNESGKRSIVDRIRNLFV